MAVSKTTSIVSTRNTARARPKPASREPKRTGAEERALTPSELTERLSNALALVETSALALQKFDHEPCLGSIFMALNQAVVAVSSAHADVEHFLEKLEAT